MPRPAAHPAPPARHTRVAVALILRRGRPGRHRARASRCGPGHAPGPVPAAGPRPGPASGVDRTVVRQADGVNAEQPADDVRIPRAQARVEPAAPAGDPARRIPRLRGRRPAVGGGHRDAAGVRGQRVQRPCRAVPAGQAGSHRHAGQRPAAGLPPHPAGDRQAPLPDAALPELRRPPAALDRRLGAGLLLRFRAPARRPVTRVGGR